LNDSLPAVNEAALKAPAPRSDPREVATKDLSCPTCSADLPLTGDEHVGDEIFCTYCGAPCRLMVKPKKTSDQADEYAAEEDY
jgi:DNA-directed RNA polymerase subunit RPC12/RpoP